MSVEKLFEEKNEQEPKLRIVGVKLLLEELKRVKAAKACTNARSLGDFMKYCALEGLCKVESLIAEKKAPEKAAEKTAEKAAEKAAEKTAEKAPKKK